MSTLYIWCHAYNKWSELIKDPNIVQYVLQFSLQRRRIEYRICITVFSAEKVYWVQNMYYNFVCREGVLSTEYVLQFSLQRKCIEYRICITVFSAEKMYWVQNMYYSFFLQRRCSEYRICITVFSAEKVYWVQNIYYNFVCREGVLSTEYVLQFSL
jgi:hypothetical protein